MRLQTFEKKTFRVEAVQVTLENMPEVVKWTKGSLAIDDLHRPYISVAVSRPANVKQTMAYETDWVLKTVTGFRIYTDFAFRKSFDEVKAPKRNSKEASRVDPYQQDTVNSFELPGVDRKVVEEPVGDEKIVQGESVETRPETDEEFGQRAAKTFNTFRTPQQIREAHRTGSSGFMDSAGRPLHPEDLDPSVPKASDGRADTYLANYYAEHGHYPAENVDQRDS